MPMLPVPLFAAAILLYLALRTSLGGGRPLLALLLLACGAQSVLVALMGGYGVEALRIVLPVGAATIPPLAWITFRDALVGRVTLREAAPHALAPSFALFARLFAPGTIDAVVPALFLGYGGAILLGLRGATDLPLARLSAGAAPVTIWRALGVALIASAAMDGLIALAYARDQADWAGWLITAASSLALVAIGLLGTEPAASGTTEEEPPAPPATEAPPERLAEDAAIMARVEAFLAREPLHLDPDLTLTRLARRLHLPEKRLSSAVNRATGGNVSRYVNAHRIAHACKLIEGGDPITEAMLASGFNTKSNFNREFRRVTGISPSEWTRTRAGSPSDSDGSVLEFVAIEATNP